MLTRLLPSGSRARALAFGLIGFCALFIFTQVLLPGTDGGGTPSAALFQGLVKGLLTSLVSAGIILIYRTTRIINFSQAALGSAGSIFTYNLAILLGWPFLLAFLGGILVSALIGLVVEISFIRRFFDAPRLVLTVLSIALVGFLAAASGFIGGLPIFGDQRDRDVLSLPQTVPLPFPNFEFRIGDFPLDFGFAELFALGVSVVALLGLGYFFRYTRAGVAVRAAAENTDRALLLGINVKGLSTLVWVIAGLLSGVGVIANGAVSGFSRGGDFSPSLLMNALAASVMARMQSLPVALAASVGIIMGREALEFSFPNQARLGDVGLFVLIVGALLFQKQKLLRSESGEATAWKATEEHRPIPKELMEITGVRIWRYALMGLGVVVVLLFPWVTPTGTINRGGYVAIVGIVVLSLVVLTGWAGQVSLGQFALVAVGAVVGGALTSRAGIPFWLAMPVGASITAGFAILIGLPALRIKGLFLGVTTFAFAAALQAALFREEYFGWILPERVDRPTLFLLDFEDERSMYYLCVAALLLSVVVVTTLRRSRTGRVLIALRDNSPNAQSFGINIVRTKLAAFALSGFLSGFAGVLLAHHQRAVSEASFRLQDSIDVFLYGVVGGIGSVSGALLGAGYFAVTSLLQGNPIVQFFAGNFGILLILYVAPGGLTAVAFGLRDSILRIVAQRRQLVVPSLFADIDPESAALQLVPLSEPLSNTGLAALPFTQRYRLASGVHGLRKREALVSRSPVREAVAIGAAAESMQAGTEEIPVPASTGE